MPPYPRTMSSSSSVSVQKESAALGAASTPVRKKSIKSSIVAISPAAAGLRTAAQESAREVRRIHRKMDEEYELVEAEKEHRESLSSESTADKQKPRTRKTDQGGAIERTKGKKDVRRGRQLGKKKVESIPEKSDVQKVVGDENKEAAFAPITPKKPATSSKKTISPRKIAPSSSTVGGRLSDRLKEEPTEVVDKESTTGAESAGISISVALSEETKKMVSRAYRIIARHRGLAYGTPNSPIYGENTETSMRRALHAMGLGSSPLNVFCDVGSGTGAPSIHAACEFPSINSYGFELMGSRWWISQTILLSMLKDPMVRQACNRVMLAHVDLTHVTDFGPCTHVYSFDTGFPHNALKAYAKAFNASKNIKVLASYMKQKTLEQAGFEGLSLREQFSMRMTGSSEGHTIHLYDVTKRTSQSQPQPLNDVPSSWDITRLYPPPTDSLLAPSVPHSDSYAQGEQARLNGLDSYLIWVEDQVGLGRTAGVKTRGSLRRQQ